MTGFIFSISENITPQQELITRVLYEIMLIEGTMVGCYYQQKTDTQKATPITEN